MDEEHIGLQNIMYEKRHIVEEIVKCCEFRYIKTKERIYIYMKEKVIIKAYI